MKKLSKPAEELLREILENRNEKGNCISSYWEKRFEALSAVEDIAIRTTFKELSDAGAIKVQWGDNIPYLIFVLPTGLSYFDEIEEYPSQGTYVNNFYGDSYGIQIQQGNVNSVQKQHNNTSLDTEKIDELLQTLSKYDSLLESEFGKKGAETIRICSNNLTNTSDDRKRKALSIIRDICVNAGGSLIAAGIIQLIAQIMG